MNRLLTVIAGCVCMLAAHAAYASPRYFYDIHTASPGKTVKLDAVSPDNAGERRTPFADNFTYTLTRLSDGKELWSRKQGEHGRSEASPMRAYVHDDGWVVVWNSWHQLMVLHKDTGAVTAVASILDQFPEAETKKYVAQTRSGPMWAAASATWWYSTLDERIVFVITTGWGRRVVMDVAKGEYIDVAPEVELMPEGYPRAEDILREAIKNLDALCTPKRVIPGEVVVPPVTMRELTPALAELLREGDKQLVPSLRELERCALPGASGVRLTTDGRYENRINPFEYREFMLRQIAQLGLRRLGAKPSALPGAEISDGWHVGKRLPAPRGERVDSLKRGMTPRDVLLWIGHPDLVRLDGNGSWEYDIDDAEPYTLELHFDAVGMSIDRIERVPPKWQGEQRWNDVFGL